MVFQAMDAAGKDGTIRHVMSSVNLAEFRLREVGTRGPAGARQPPPTYR